MDLAPDLIAGTALRDRFASLIQRLGGSRDPAAAGDALVAAWAAPGRTYHSTSHLIDCLERLDELESEIGHRAAIEAALWFHDAVYDPQADDSESRSAAWAERVLGRLGVARSGACEIGRLIRLTRHVVPPGDPSGMAVCDIDLSILGRGPAEFDAYDAAIRAEYAWLNEQSFREGRRRLLSAILSRQPIYQLVELRARYEDAARANLRRALDRLDASK